MGIFIMKNLRKYKKYINIGSYCHFDEVEEFVSLTENKVSCFTFCVKSCYYLFAKRNDRKEKRKLFLNRMFEKYNKNVFFPHAGFVNNFAHLDEKKRNIFVKGFLTEIDLCKFYSLENIIIHAGSNVKKDFSPLYCSIIEILSKTENFSLVLENSCGAGSQILSDISKYKDIFFFLSDKVENGRLLICLDTAHLIAASYDINEKDVFLNIMKSITFKKFSTLIIHLNDTDCFIGERKDRHRKLFSKYITVDFLKFFFRTILYYIEQKFFKSVNIICETPLGIEDRALELKKLYEILFFL